MEDKKSMKASLLTQHSLTKSFGAKEEVLAFLSFEKTKNERTLRKYKLIYYILLVFCFLWTLYNTTFMALWANMNIIITSEKYEKKCKDVDFVVNWLSWIHAIGMFNIVFCTCAGKREKKKSFLIAVLFVLAQLIGRIFIYGQYFGLPEGQKGCPLEDYDVSKPDTVKSLLIVECSCDAIILALCLHLVWLLNKIRGRQKLFNIVEKMGSI